MGSPPQVRGKPYVYSSVNKSFRITPAGAGKTVYERRIRGPLRDHPRRCGENISTGSIITSFTGSPPQVRGKPGIYKISDTEDRITPAGAGKTRFPQQLILFCQDHPRRCGENGFVACGYNIVAGSPPQVRGKLPIDLNEIAKKRITPAGAGKTICTGPNNATFRDHPRRCGENLFDSLFAVRLVGSPPQVRGKHLGRDS